jgi:DNA primase
LTGFYWRTDFMAAIPHDEKPSPNASFPAAAVTLCQAQLKTRPEVLTDLLARGIDAEAVEHFKLGWCEEGRFAGRVTIPICDENGHVVQLAGWKLRREKHKEAAPRVLYLPTTMQGVFNVSGLVGARDIVLCESVIDALGLWCSGTRFVSATFGLMGLTEEMLLAFHRFGVQNIRLSFERDALGQQAMTEIARRLVAAGFTSEPA